MTYFCHHHRLRKTPANFASPIPNCIINRLFHTFSCTIVVTVRIFFFPLRPPNCTACIPPTYRPKPSASSACVPLCTGSQLAENVDRERDLGAAVPRGLARCMLPTEALNEHAEVRLYVCVFYVCIVCMDGWVYECRYHAILLPPLIANACRRDERSLPVRSPQEALFTHICGDHMGIPFMCEVLSPNIPVGAQKAPVDR